MNNILFIYPSWEERAFLGFKTDVEYHKIHTVYIIKKTKSLNIEKTSFYLKKIEEYCVSHNIQARFIDIETNGVVKQIMHYLSEKMLFRKCSEMD